MAKKKRILILYTGGTIGMIPGREGYLPDPGSFKQVLDAIPELYHAEMADWDLLQFKPLLDSSDIAVREWNSIGACIEGNYTHYDGFVVLHGTDTMAYTASALSFMLENLSKPVVFTGAQIPLCCLRSDGRDNLVTAMIIAASGRVHEVCLYFHGVLLRGNRSMKFSSDQFAAFDSPNFPHLADVGIHITYNDAALLPPCQGPFRLQKFKELPIGVLKVFPGIQFELFASIMTECLRGVVLETFGAGNIPGYGHALLPIIERAYRNGTIITVCSQCPQGTVSIGTYAVSKPLRDIGAVSGKDMTTEAAVTKLYYLFSCAYTTEEIKEKMAANLRGELTP